MPGINKHRGKTPDSRARQDANLDKATAFSRSFGGTSGWTPERRAAQAERLRKLKQSMTPEQREAAEQKRGIARFSRKLDQFLAREMARWPGAGVPARNWTPETRAAHGQAVRRYMASGGREKLQAWWTTERRREASRRITNRHWQRKSHGFLLSGPADTPETGQVSS